MNRGPNLFELLVDALTSAALVVWEKAHALRQKVSG